MPAPTCEPGLADRRHYSRGAHSAIADNQVTVRQVKGTLCLISKRLGNTSNRSNSILNRQRFSLKVFGAGKLAGHVTIPWMDLSDADIHGRVAAVVESEENVATGMRRLISYCAGLRPDKVWSEMQKLDFDTDAENLKLWLENVLVSEPPGAKITAFWFGLFDGIEEDEQVTSTLYIAGTETYDPEDDDADWASSPDYFPEHRYAESPVLRSISRLLDGCDDDVSELGSYALPLAYAALAIKQASRLIPPDTWLQGHAVRALAVGFDSGDFITIPEITTQSARQVDKH